jgi:hypothetical protein
MNAFTNDETIFTRKNKVGRVKRVGVGVEDFLVYFIVQTSV